MTTIKYTEYLGVNVIQGVLDLMNEVKKKIEKKLFNLKFE